MMRTKKTVRQLMREIRGLKDALSQECSAHRKTEARCDNYRRVVVDIHQTIGNCVSESKTINQGWILQRIGQLL